jgi:hypothetical protein
MLATTDDGLAGIPCLTVGPLSSRKSVRMALHTYVIYAAGLPSQVTGRSFNVTPALRYDDSASTARRRKG